MKRRATALLTLLLAALCAEAIAMSAYFSIRPGERLSSRTMKEALLSGHHQGDHDG